MSRLDPITLTIDRRILEHPRSFHRKRMRGSIWLYLFLLSRLPSGEDKLDLNPLDVAPMMGLPEGTIRTWLGQLRKHRYVTAKRTNGSIRVKVKRVVRESVKPQETKRPDTPTRFFTVAKLEQALDETGNRDSLEEILAKHPDEVVKRALAGAIAVPAEQIRRSRTALFIYLLKRHAQTKTTNDSRP
ncbi:MAG: hypothetical protein KJ927_04130 [Candidatus Eisenbacteria bacterium]|nr:hypothetical protein [Candidatus Eisenbacteria bacterium]MBU1947877.1 hypothetical protein [Candidatus Eisenbacteria bacterium]